MARLSARTTHKALATLRLILILQHTISQKLTMSKPTAGTYYIINKVLSNDDDKLALTYGGQGAAATVTPLNNSSSQQVWAMAFCHVLPSILCNGLTVENCGL